MSPPGAAGAAGPGRATRPAAPPVVTVDPSDLRRVALGGRWTPVAVLVLGVVSVLMLIGIHWFGTRLLLQDVALLHAIGEVQRRVATSHLWLEELVTGDQVPAEEIVSSLEAAKATTAAILEGGEIDRGWIHIEPIDDPEKRHQVAAARELLDEFTAITHRRLDGYAAGEPVGIGSPMDAEYDRVFQRLVDVTLGLDAAIGTRTKANRARSAALYRAMVAAWAAIVILAVGGLWTYERRRRLAESALAESERQLLQAQKMEAVGRLAGGIAHDINNYLAAITAQCERVKMKAGLDDPMAARMEEAIETAFKASSLIRRLLAFGRQQPVRRQLIDLNEVVADLEPMMRRLLGSDVRLETRLAPNLGAVEMDPSQLEQVIVNLLVNAREAMASGGRVTIDTANLTSDVGGERRELVVLAVADTGTGIPPAVRDKIFEPFFTTKGESGSSGLGLATVYGIVTQSGGRIRVDSEPGSGTEFTLYFPRAAGEASRQVKVERRAELPRGTEAVLLIEDNDEFRESARELLAELGYRVTAATCGDEAVAAFEHAGGDFDLVISDVVMPDRSGPEVVDHLRERKPELRVLFISGTSGNLILRHGLRRGEFDLLEKPFSLELFARTIREILDRPLSLEAAVSPL